MRKISAVIFIFIFCAASFSQAGRKMAPPSGSSPDEVSAKRLYEQAESYARNKFEEFNQKKRAYDDDLRLKILRDQRQLAARNALIISSRKNVLSSDLYYLGSLYWLAENQDGAYDAFTKFLASGNAPKDHLQNSRGFLIVISAKRKNFAEAEKLLAAFSEVQPIKWREKAKLMSEIAAGYKAEGNFEEAEKKASEAFKIYRTLSNEAATPRTRILQDIIDSGYLLFDIYADAGKTAEAENTLIELRKASIPLQSVGIYFRAADKQIIYLIEQQRKKEAMQLLAKIYESLPKDLPNAALISEVSRSLKKREKHYGLINEIAPELNIDKWIGTQRKLSDMRGKVILLDFWATWCGPCREVFPFLVEWDEAYKKEGLEIIGVTRYYRTFEGIPNGASDAEIDRLEIAHLKEFKKEEGLTYDFAVGLGDGNQRIYGALSLPTAILIDRKGKIRYIRTGTGDEETLKKWVLKLLAEK